VHKSVFTQKVFHQNAISEIPLSACRKKGVCEAEVVRDQTAYTKTMQIKFYRFE